MPVFLKTLSIVMQGNVKEEFIIAAYCFILLIGNDDNNGNSVETQTNGDVCVAKSSIYSISAFFIVGLTLSVSATLFLFLKTRNTSMRKDERN